MKAQFIIPIPYSLDRLKVQQAILISMQHKYKKIHQILQSKFQTKLKFICCAKDHFGNKHLCGLEMSIYIKAQMSIGYFYLSRITLPKYVAR